MNTSPFPTTCAPLGTKRGATENGLGIIYFGLLSLADAELARKLLPLEWGDHDPHAHVTICALYERA